MREKEKKDLERKVRKERHHRSPTPETEPPGMLLNSHPYSFLNYCQVIRRTSLNQFTLHPPWAEGGS